MAALRDRKLAEPLARLAIKPTRLNGNKAAANHQVRARNKLSCQKGPVYMQAPSRHFVGRAIPQRSSIDLRNAQSGFQLPVHGGVFQCGLMWKGATS